MIWRVENNEGSGPYHRIDDEVRRDYFEYIERRNFGDEDIHPYPSPNDLISYGFEIETHRFGFYTIRQLMDWFGDTIDDFVAMEKAGYFIAFYSAKDLFQLDRQCAFVPDKLIEKHFPTKFKMSLDNLDFCA